MNRERIVVEPLVLALLCVSVGTVASSEESQVRSLDGTWQIVFDPGNEGIGEAWHRSDRLPKERERDIVVPSCWELLEKDYEGAAFYRRTFRVPASWKGQVIRLRFDAVNFRSEVWINDQAVGVHEGGFTPFEFVVDDLLRIGGENTLVLRVVGPILLEGKRVDGIGPMETPQWRGAITGGIWQSVRLIASGEVYLHDVFIEPKISDDTATLHLQLVHTGAQATRAQVAIAVRSLDEPDRVVASSREMVELRPGTNRRSRTLEIRDAKYWSPDEPELYRADVSVTRDGSVSDHSTRRFGMRELTIVDKKFRLNGERVYIKATFFEGLYPRALAFPDSREMAIREIRLAKRAGFNMIRPWRKPPPPMWLDLADEIGVMVVGSLAVECMDFPVESARLQGWVENEVRESILRDRSRACVVQWELFNELKRPVLKRMLRPMSVLARELDPTRLILDESGGWAQGANIYLPYEHEPTKFNDVHHYPGSQIDERIYDKLLWTGRKTHEEMRRMGLAGPLPGRNVVSGRMTFFSELGYGSLPDLVDNNQRFAAVGSPIAPPTIYHRRLADAHRRVLKESGFNRVYPELRRFCLDQQKTHGIANRRMIEAVRCNSAVEGYCVHALTAGDWILGAGLLDLFRQPKTFAYEGTRAANQPRILSLRVRPRNVYAERGARLEITGVNDESSVSGNLNVEVVGARGSRVLTKTIRVEMSSGISQLFAHSLDTAVLEGAYSVKAELVTDEGVRVAENEHEFDVFPTSRTPVPKGRVALLDPSDSLKPFLQRSGIAFVEFDARTDRSLPVLVSRTVARNSRERKLFGSLEEFLRTGGLAVYLQGGGPRVRWGKAGIASPLLPVDARTKRSVGTWIGISHIVRDHPVFDGLPVDCMMGAIYENVWARGTLLGLDARPIVGSIGFDCFPDYDKSRRHYYGPGDAWWGSDLAVVPVGEGRCVLSQLRLVEHLGSDPVADKILFNLIAWISAR